MKHDYTNEVELKSLAIREKNKILNLREINEQLNFDIDELIKEYMKTKNTILRDEIIRLSEQTSISTPSHERFGEIVILMIRKILTKSNFAGYTWRDEFFSDACYRVFKYIHNFNHNLKSDVTGQSVSCFSYITQIIHNSILAIINDKNKRAKEMENYAHTYNSEYGIFEESRNKSTFNEKEKESIVYNLEKFILSDVNDIITKHKNDDINLIINYSNSYITSDDYSSLRDVLRKIKCTVNLSKV